MSFNLDLTHGNFKDPWEKIHNAAKEILHSLAGISDPKYRDRQWREDDSENFLNKIHMPFINRVYPELSSEKSREFISRTVRKLHTGYDSDTISSLIAENKPKLEEIARTQLVRQVLSDMARFNCYAARTTYIIAEIIENEYGMSERTRYIEAVLCGECVPPDL